MNTIIINAEGLVAGRLASKIAKEVIKGENVIVFNASKAIIVGKESAIMPKYSQRVNARVLSNPLYGPKYHRIPSKMLRRMVKGMLPNKSRTAERLIKQLEIFNDTPKEIDVSKAITYSETKCNDKHEFMYLEDLAKKLGGNW